MSMVAISFSIQSDVWTKKGTLLKVVETKYVYGLQRVSLGNEKFLVLSSTITDVFNSNQMEFRIFRKLFDEFACISGLI